ncbi:sn-glycerol-3-phosphate ABC transporter ATP-binding protein UgpC [Devosia rhodophyticola]|uniref:Sn-glycerol-3-phosphate ABC transporter ATP-binding protein UgpC n=1 Tax=Devosia rhodophyticola TaxID=3026423 RepID=A0ABY7YYQ4_9HYPH|nr:sn-glycerol-3-phosphate ABC transporter ATP-binding protein UgpC [Devosia rhodophyticola]WDR06145.1 sn-glycerol-3-phosphate ABC transporter ATP-binding protein UgpC [Devosia rhodophyticola]
MASVSINQVTKQFGAVSVIRGANLHVEDGELVVFVGPSGCGKSTLLRMIAGLEDISSGDIHIGDTMVNDIEPGDRGVAMVFQSYALYPHMSVQQNMSFGLRMNGNEKADTERRVQTAAKVLQLKPLLARLPKQLSGGQRQRVAIGRAIVREPQVFLFDEPLSNLDAELRVQMRVEIARLHKELQATMIYVTHDQTEAMTLADRIVVLRDGLIEQVGSPLELYHNPANAFVAGFIGSPRINFFTGVATEYAEGHQLVQLSGRGSAVAKVATTEALPSGTLIKVGVRPEHFEIGGACGFPIKVDVVEQLGSVSYLYADTTSEYPLIVARQDDGDHRSDELTISIRAGKALLFGADGNRLR